ncbi:hypothetical protein [Caproiciproducens galactitolivorans]|uniref:hypothetical protein n=1 Tax=Caproiciproducens galactitolivorans TaxID=642589 RepID=UPI00240A756D|nr:hypothetical protein [Caproiciproducens galactitolivorans]
MISIFLAAGDILNWAKLELGGTATAFSPRPYAEELLLCQRFFERQDNILIKVPPALTSFDQTFPYRTQKRCSASMQVYSPSGTAGKVGLFLQQRLG